MARTLLVVDDSTTIREAVHHALAGEDWQVVNAETLAEALAAVRDHQPDAVLCDVSLREVDGYEACRSIRETPGGSVPLILMGAAVNDTAAMTAGVSSILGKPFASDELVEALGAAVEGSFAFDGEGFAVDEGEPLVLEPAHAVTGGAPAEDAEEVEIIDLSEDEGFGELEVLEDLEPIELEPVSPPERGTPASPAEETQPMATEAPEAPGGDFLSSFELEPAGPEPLSTEPEEVSGEAEEPFLEPTAFEDAGPLPEAAGETPEAELDLSGGFGDEGELVLEPIHPGGDQGPTEGTEAGVAEPSAAPPTAAAVAPEAAEFEPEPGPSRDEEEAAAGEAVEELGWEDVFRSADEEPAPAPLEASTEAAPAEAEAGEEETWWPAEEPGEGREREPAAELRGAEPTAGEPESAMPEPVAALGEQAFLGAIETPEIEPEPPAETPSDYEFSWGEAEAAETAGPAEPATEPEAAGLVEADLSVTTERVVREALAASLSAEKLTPVVEAVVERVVWEVVPQLAERLIREAIERLKEPPPAA